MKQLYPAPLKLSSPVLAKRAAGADEQEKRSPLQQHIGWHRDCGASRFRLPNDGASIEEGEIDEQAEPDLDFGVASG
jgi:hypothetical protein